MSINGDVSFWFSDIGGLPRPRPGLAANIDADVAIVGAGYTGLWTAYYLKREEPSLRIAVIEKEFAGFGASGRNGGWLSGGFAWSREKYMQTSTRDSVVAMERAMAGTVDEVISVAQCNGIDADIVRCHTLRVATNAAQLERLHSYRDEFVHWGMGDQVELLSADAARRQIAVSGVEAALVKRGNARVQPAKLVRGLAALAERIGVEIYEQTTATEIVPGCVRTSGGLVRSPVIIRATEGFSASIRGHKRTWLPLNSAQLVTEPLSEAMWREIGWDENQLLADMAHDYFYAQRTRQGRIAIGFSGNPYRFASKTSGRGETSEQTIRYLQSLLIRLLPQTRNVTVDHAWCGVMGVPRDWCTTVGLDPDTGLGWAGGYVGLGVSSSNLGGRTLRDLVLGRDTELTRLPWVNRTVRKWEPEPLRWLGVHAMHRLLRAADIRERAGISHTSRLAKIAQLIGGE